MWSVILQSPPDREELQGFGLTLGLLVGASSGGLGMLVGLPGSAAVALGFGVAGGLAAMAWQRPDRFEPVYQGWNRIAKGYARRARTAVIAIAFFTVVAAAGWTGGALELRPWASNDSRWRERPTLPDAEYPGQGHGLRNSRSGAFGDLMAWAPRSGQGWTVFLIPFLWLAAAFDLSDQAAPPDSIYTLY